MANKRTCAAHLAALFLQALLLLGAAGHAAHAGEIDERKQIATRVARHLAEGDFASLDTWYTQALQQNTRTPGGDLQANQLVRSIAFGAERGAPGAAEPYWQAQESKALSWAQSHPKSTLAAIALSKVYAYRAWDLRAGDADKVRALNQQGLDALQARAEAGRKDPNWWAVLLTQAHNTRMPAGDQARLAQDAVAAFPRNAEIYVRIATTRAPQWGGSHQALADLASQAVDNSQAEEGQSFYARIYWSVQDQLAPDGKGAFTHRQVQWPRIRAGFEDLVQRYPDPYNTNSYARLACVAARDRKTTAALLQRIGHDIVQQAWRSREEFMGCQAWAQRSKGG